MCLVPDRADVDFRLNDWLVQPAQCRLSREGRTLQVRPKVMDLLTYLAAHAGEVVSKEQLLNDVWGAQAVSRSALTGRSPNSARPSATTPTSHGCSKRFQSAAIG